METVAVSEKVKAFREQVESLKEERQFFTNEADRIDSALRSTRSSLAQLLAEEEVALPTVKEKTPFKISNIKELSWEIFQSDGEMNEADLAIKLAERGYKPNMDSSEVVAYVNKEAIEPLVKEGKLTVTGKAPHRKYKPAS